MIPVEEAKAKILAAVKTTAAETISVWDGLGRTLAADVAATINQPRIDVSAMDGYGVRAEDVASVPATLNVIGESPAGGAFDGNVGKGEAVRIFTGAPVPAGADTIIIQEVCTRDADSVTINETTTKGRFVRKAGMDFATGDVLLTAGKTLGPRELALAAAMNVAELSVRKKPRVAILATGNEVVMPGEALGPTQIISSNSVLLCAYLESIGCEAESIGIAPDDAGQLRACIERAAGFDILITIGGASVGDHDLVNGVLADLGMDLIFYKVAMRPGKPLIFGKLGDTTVFGLPGNPVSVGVTSAVFIRPAIQKMLGVEMSDEITQAVLGGDLRENDEREDYLRARFSFDDEGLLVATPFSKQDSAMLARFAEADGLIIRAPRAPAADAGEIVDVMVL